MSAFSTDAIAASSVDGSATVTLPQVVGNKADSAIMTPGTSSLYQIAGYMGYYHVHSPAQCYPVLADPVTVTASANAWTDYGAWVEIVPAGTITDPFDIHWVQTTDISANGNYVLQLGVGGAGSEVAIATIAFSRDTNQVQGSQQPVQVAPLPAGSRISARLSSSKAAANTADVKIYYHVYP